MERSTAHVMAADTPSSMARSCNDLLRSHCTATPFLAPRTRSSSTKPENGTSELGQLSAKVVMEQCVRRR